MYDAAFFLFHRKDLVALKYESVKLSYETKTLRVDRTAAEKRYVACRDPPQAENLASEILCSVQMLDKMEHSVGAFGCTKVL